MSDQLADTHADVGGRRQLECRKTGLTMLADDTRLNVGQLDQRRRTTLV